MYNILFVNCKYTSGGRASMHIQNDIYENPKYVNTLGLRHNASNFEVDNSDEF